eukprot:TRINITY_DN19174_c0_g2_i1.p1 TRINITY_DN19174_c0_g2~~TRINITY_DN19174_c0_g2_i1.p1  ORF type:complete len:106 (-),score=9.26 TRINITY_DN19174_c0_g2_i1:395-712(-)
MLRSLVGSEMCIRDRYQRRVRGLANIPYGDTRNHRQAPVPRGVPAVTVALVHERGGQPGLPAPDSGARRSGHPALDASVLGRIRVRHDPVACVDHCVPDAVAELG